jgi:hypothetical protein
VLRTLLLRYVSSDLRLVIQSRWVSTRPVFAGMLQPRRLINWLLWTHGGRGSSRRGWRHGWPSSRWGSTSRCWWRRATTTSRSCRCPQCVGGDSWLRFPSDSDFLRR